MSVRLGSGGACGRSDSLSKDCEFATELLGAAVVGSGAAGAC